MYVKTDTVTVITAGGGGATEYSTHLNGRLFTVRYTKTDFADGSTFTITGETTGQDIWTETGVNASTQRSPHHTASKAVDGANYNLGVGLPAHAPLVVNERIKVVITSGGATATGTFFFMVA